MKLIEKGLKKKKISNAIISLIIIGNLIRIPVNNFAVISFTEIILALMLVFLPIFMMNKRLEFNKFDQKILTITLLIITLLIIQVIVNYQRLFSVFLLFEYLFIGIVFLIIFKFLAFNHNVYFKTLLFFSYYLTFNNIYFNVFNYETGQYSNIIKFGSSNYTSALMLIIIPTIFFYIRQNENKILNNMAYISIFLMIFSVVFAGSRSNIAILLFQIVVFLFLVKNSITKRLKMFFIIAITIVGAYFVLEYINPELKFIINRYISYFTESSSDRRDILDSDLIRDRLKDEAKVIINDNKLWGIGYPRIPQTNTPVHNFIYEIILAIGYIGFVIYSIYFTIFVVGVLKGLSKQNSIRLLYLVMILTFLSISLFHPFMTSGKEFTIIFWMNVIAFKFFRTSDGQKGNKMWRKK